MRSTTVSSLGERALIQRITARVSLPPWVVVGPGDDAAVIEPERGALEVLTTDAQVEGVHFDRRFVPPDAIGHRALAVNLSDLAAMGASPRVALLSLALPDALEVETVDQVLEGLLGLATQQHVVLVGGNITRTPGPFVIDVTLTGSVRPRRVLTRAGARPGDEVYVTGTIGDAVVGLRSLQGRAALAAGLDSKERCDNPPRSSLDLAEAVQFRFCEGRYLRPEPRVRAGVLLGRNRAASACMDLSDGLADGVRQVSEASGVGMCIDAAALPISEEARRWHTGRGQDAVSASVAGGDDYELLFTVRPSHKGRLRAVQKETGNLPITRIGVVTRERRLLVRAADGDRQLPPGFEHFR
ncbi:MAG TPA: thiamine-phosphate kinase [Vicinamibacterales bacterium]